MKFDFKKYMPIIVKLSGCMMAFAVVVTNFTQNSTCFAIFHQPKVPNSLLESDE